MEQLLGTSPAAALKYKELPRKEIAVGPLELPDADEDPKSMSHAFAMRTQNVHRIRCARNERMAACG